MFYSCEMEVILLLLVLFLFLDDSISEKQWMSIPESKWDNEWKSGLWKYMDTVAIERGKVAVIGGVLIPTYASSNASVLDVGCGEGAISDFLHPSQKAKYVGVDLSSEAIKSAKKLRGQPMKFVHSAAHEFHPKHQFDVVIFSDMLYYVEHEKVIKQYYDYLTPNGVMIISIFYMQDNKLLYENIWNFARGLMKKVDEMDMSGYTKKGKSDKLVKTAFHLEVYKKSP